MRLRLFDYLVGELLERGEGLDRQFGRFGAFQNLVYEVGSVVLVFKIVDSVADEPASTNEF